MPSDSWFSTAHLHCCQGPVVIYLDGMALSYGSSGSSETELTQPLLRGWVEEEVSRTTMGPMTLTRAQGHPKLESGMVRIVSSRVWDAIRTCQRLCQTMDKGVKRSRCNQWGHRSEASLEVKLGRPPSQALTLPTTVTRHLHVPPGARCCTHWHRFCLHIRDGFFGHQTGEETKA